MTELDSRCLDAFPNWLRSLSDDARALIEVVENSAADEKVRRRAAGALNYLFRSLDLIPDGIEDLGFIDDAFVLRAAAAQASEGGLIAQDPGGNLARLASEAGLIREFLGDIYPRLETFVRGLDTSAARGRTVDDVMKDDSVRQEFAREVRTWADGYVAPSFARDDKNLVKLKSFLAAKLPPA
jgi:uncharacterized membrane protein YkvA (DUF1232 family)